jgi:transposase
MMPNDFPPWEVVYQQTQQWISAGVVEAMVHALRAVLRQEATGESAELAYVDRNYAGEEASADAEGIRLEVVKHPDAKKGFVLLPRRCLVERSFAWASRFRWLAKDYELLPQTVAGLHFVAFACLFFHRAIGPRP